MKYYIVTALDADGCQLSRFESGTNKRVAIKEAKDTFHRGSELIDAGMVKVTVTDDVTDTVWFDLSRTVAADLQPLADVVASPAISELVAEAVAKKHLESHKDCQCEHDVHFARPFTMERHAYALARSATVVKTPYSTMAVCQFCADNCLAIYRS